MADTPPWIDLNVRMVYRYGNRYTHAHDFNDGQLSYYSIAFTQAQIQAWFTQLQHTDIISRKEYTRERTRMTVTLTLYNSSTLHDALKLREVIDAQFRKHRHEVPPLPRLE